MKKLVVFLIPLIVSIPAFTQDKSLFAQNFSFAKYSRNNYFNFFNLHTPSSVNNLFQTEKFYHSKQYIAYQVHKIHQFPERIHFLRTIAIGTRKQNWGDVHNFIFGHKENISAKEESVSLAESYLRRLAKKRKNNRIIVGYGSLIFGGLLFVEGIRLTKEEEGGYFDIDPLLGPLGIIGGAACALGGIHILAISSRAEEKLNAVLSISNPALREWASHRALSSLATESRRYRKYFQKYLREKERQQRRELAILVGIMPYGGVKIGFVYSF